MGWAFSTARTIHCITKSTRWSMTPKARRWELEVLHLRSLSPPRFSQTHLMQNISREQHSPIIIRLETFQRLYKRQLKCRKTHSKDPLSFINKNKHWNETFSFSPASVLWAPEAFCLLLFCLHNAYPTPNFPDLQTRAGAYCREHTWCARTSGGRGETPHIAEP